MSETQTSDTLCSGCQKSGAFKPRIDLNSFEIYVDGLSKCDPFILDHGEIDKMVLLCDQDLKDYEAEMMVLQEKQARLRAHKARILSLTSPIRKLPNEVLALVFDYACEWNVLQEFPWPKKTHRPTSQMTLPIVTYLPALCISFVCARFRSLTRFSPSLWSRLKLEITSGRDVAPGALTAFIATVDLFLIRSDQHPLSISLEIRAPPQKQNPPVLDLLIAHCHRWKTFQYNSRWYISHYLDYEPNFTTLESLDLHSDFSVILSELEIFQNTPKLRELVLYGLNYDTDNTENLELSQMRMPCSQFTHIDIDAGGEVADILIECPNIISLKIRDSQNAGVSFPSPRIFSSTKALSVVATHSLLNAVLSSFTFPVLDHLCILADPNDKMSEKDWPQALFTKFLSHCRITTLVMSAMGISDAELVSALQHLTSLVTLEISDLDVQPKDTPITSHLFSSLRQSTDQSTLLSSDSRLPLIPKLRYIVLDFGGPEFDDVAFIYMVSSRSRFPRPQFPEIDQAVDFLRSVVLRFHKREVDQTAYKPLLDLDKLGLMVVVRGMNGMVI